MTTEETGRLSACGPPSTPGLPRSWPRSREPPPLGAPALLAHIPSLNPSSRRVAHRPALGEDARLPTLPGLSQARSPHAEHWETNRTRHTVRSLKQAGPNTLEPRVRDTRPPAPRGAQRGKRRPGTRACRRPGPRLPLTRSALPVPSPRASALPLAAGAGTGAGGGAARSRAGRALTCGPCRDVRAESAGNAAAHEGRRAGRDVAAPGLGKRSQAGRASAFPRERSRVRRTGSAGPRQPRRPARPDETCSPSAPAALGRREGRGSARSLF